MKLNFRQTLFITRVVLAAFAVVTCNWAALLLVMFVPFLPSMRTVLGIIEEGEIETLIGKMADKHKQAFKTEIENATAGLLKADDFATKLSEAGIDKATIEKLTQAVEEQGLALAKFAKPDDAVKTVDAVINENASNISKLVDAKRGESLTLKFSKEAIEARKTQVTRASVSNNTMAYRLPGVGQLAYMGTVMSGLFNHVQLADGFNGVIRYFDQNAITRGADVVAEGATKPESEITWIERLASVKKIADSIPVTKEAFRDVSFIRSEIERLLDINLALKEDFQIYRGDGTGENITGLYTTAPTFDAGGYAGDKFADANLYDLLAVLRVVIVDNAQSKYMPNFVLMNPKTILKYKLAKGTDGHYVLPPFITSNGQVIDGMSVVESSQVVANTLALGDSRFGTIYDLEGVTVEMGYINDQFVKNAMTILAEKREMLLIRNVDASGFLKVTDIDAAIAAITE